VKLKRAWPGTAVALWCWSLGASSYRPSPRRAWTYVCPAVDPKLARGFFTCFAALCARR
jgi:hypothetical protein